MTEDTIISQLHAENAALAAEIDELHREIAALKEQLEAQRNARRRAAERLRRTMEGEL